MAYYKLDTDGVQDMLERVELSDRADEPVRNFSKGMTQRLGLPVEIDNDANVACLAEALVGVALASHVLAPASACHPIADRVPAEIAALGTGVGAAMAALGVPPTTGPRPSTIASHASLVRSQRLSRSMAK